ncbi:MAG: alpha/beta fold hydrolase [bacterium]
MQDVILVIVAFLLCLFILGTVAICIFLYPRVRFQNRPELTMDDYIAGGHKPEKVSFATSDGIPAVGLFYSASSEKRPIIILLHGHAYHMGAYHKRIKRLLEEGWHVFSFDFRGCGESVHPFTTIGLKETSDVLGAIEYLKTRVDVDISQTVLWGGSMGASVALRSLKLLDNVKAVIADSSYYDIFTVLGLRLKRKGAPKFMSHYFALGLNLLTGGNQWNNSAAKDIEGITSTPVLFIHGDKDVDIDVQDTIRLHKKYEGPKELLILKGHHHHDHEDVPGYLDKSINFLKKYLK